jgi:hypothetical protein
MLGSNTSVYSICCIIITIFIIPTNCTIFQPWIESIKFIAPNS